MRNLICIFNIIRDKLEYRKYANHNKSADQPVPMRGLVYSFAKLLQQYNKLEVPTRSRSCHGKSFIAISIIETCGNVYFVKASTAGGAI